MRHFRLIPQFTRLYDEGPGGASGAPAAPAPPTDPSGGSPAPTPAPSAPATSPSDPAAAGGPAPSTPGSPQQYAYEEDRSNWVPPDRMNQVIQTRLQQVIADRERYKAMLEAGAGVKFPEQRDPRLQQAQEALDQVIPGLSEKIAFLDKHKEAIERFIQLAPELESSTQTIWGMHGRRALSSAASAIAKSIGADASKLNAFQKTQIENGFVAWLQTDPSLLQRYQEGDPGLTDDYAKLWASGFVDPIRRTSQAPAARTAAQNAGLPAAPSQGGPAPGTSGAPQPKTADEVIDTAFQSLKAQRASAQV